MEGCPGIDIIKPRLVQTPEMLVMGVEVRTADRREMNPATAEIPKLWNRFIAEQLWLDIPVAVQPEVFYGVYTDYSDRRSDCSMNNCTVNDYKVNAHTVNDYTVNDYTAIVAVEVSSIDNPPESMVGVTIPAGNYLVFSAQAYSSSIIQTWQQISDYFTPGTTHRRTYTIDFERHAPEGVSIHIAIK